MSKPTQKSADRVWRTLVQVVMDSRGDWRRKVAEASGLPFGRFRALRRLDERPLTLSELAESLATDAPAASVAVNWLEEKGFAERKDHPQDRRKKLVSLTDAGRRVLKNARTVTESAPAALAELSERELEKLEQVLAAIRSPK